MKRVWEVERLVWSFKLEINWMIVSMPSKELDFLISTCSHSKVKRFICDDELNVSTIVFISLLVAKKLERK